MKKHLLIFGTDNYQNAINSLIKSSKDYFDKHHIFSPKEIDGVFFEENKKILMQPRGAGYWLWKPYFLKKTLESVEDGDIVFYVDAGNIFINDPSFLFNKMNSKNNIILFDNRDGMMSGDAAQNFISCKKDSFVLMGCDSPEYIYGKHLNASYQIYQKNNFSLEFVNEYLNFCKNEYILTDTPNTHGHNYLGYYDHRHDQSVLSLLSIKYKINPLVDPSEWGNKCGCRGFDQIFLHHRKKDYIL
jgi:hypothetical protein